MTAGACMPELSTPSNPEVGLVGDVASLDKLLTKVEEAQTELGKLTQAEVDAIFDAAALAGAQNRLRLAQLAVEESGMGVVEDKMIKNHFSTETVHAAYRHVKTCGVIESSPAEDFVKYAEPIGVLAGVIPCTNPTSTAMFKCLLALKTRNCIVISPHPRTARCTIEAARVMRDAAAAHGAPMDCIAWIDKPTPALCGELMKHDKIQMIVATGAGGLVKAAYSSGKPATGGGAGNTPVIIDETADIPMAVNSVLLSKTFDNGMICASEQSIVCVESVAEQVRAEFTRRGAYFLTEEEKVAVGNVILTDAGALNPAAVGQTAVKLAEMAGLTNAPKGVRLLLADIKEVGPAEKMSHEKLCPCLGFITVPDFPAAVEMAYKFVSYGGMGHTSVMYTDLEGPLREERVGLFQARMPTGRALVCMPTSQGAIGKIFNFFQAPSLSLGCGSWGHNSSAEALQVKHLLNIKEITTRQSVPLPYRVPHEIYCKPGALKPGITWVVSRGAKRSFILTNSKAVSQGRKVEAEVRGKNIDTNVFVVDGESTFTHARHAAEAMRQFNADTLILVGDGEVMSIGKIARLLLDAPKVDLEILAVRFMSYGSRIVNFPPVGNYIKRIVAIPTTLGSGIEMTPFAYVKAIKGDNTLPSDGAMSPIAMSPSNGSPLGKSPTATSSAAPILFLTDQDSLLPNAVIVDVELLQEELDCRPAILGLANALEAHVSVMATDTTLALSLPTAARLINRLQWAFEHSDRSALFDCFHAVETAGMAVGNTSPGLAQSLALELTAMFGVPWATAMALVIRQVVLFNSEDAPTKMGTFAQYTFPKAGQQYAEIAADAGLLAHSIEEKVDMLVQKITELIQSFKMPESLREAGIGEADFQDRLDELALRAFDSATTLANPRYPLISEVKQLYQDIFEGRVRRQPLGGPVEAQ